MSKNDTSQVVKDSRIDDGTEEPEYVADSYSDASANDHPVVDSDLDAMADALLDTQNRERNRAEEIFDEDSDNPTASSAGHPGIDEDTS